MKEEQEEVIKTTEKVLVEAVQKVMSKKPTLRQAE